MAVGEFELGFGVGVEESRGGFVSLMWSLEWDCDRAGSGDGKGRDVLL